MAMKAADLEVGVFSCQGHLYRTDGVSRHEDLIHAKR